MNVDEERLNAAYGLARRYTRELRGKDLRFEKTLNRKNSLGGC